MKSLFLAFHSSKSFQKILKNFYRFFARQIFKLNKVYKSKQESLHKRIIRCNLKQNT